MSTATPAEVVAAILAALRGKRCRLSSEKDTQADLARHWQEAGLVVTPEYRLAGGLRIDFAVECSDLLVGVEVKVQGSGQAHARQLLEYVLTGQFSHIVLVTSRGVQSIPPRFVKGTRTIPITVHTLATF